nr:immunoglobulin heavy chain junction region [Macaca mulatta]
CARGRIGHSGGWYFDYW